MAKKTAEQKAAAQAQKAQVNQTKSAQKAEITALKQSGADKSIIKTEKKANQQELKDLKNALNTGTYTPLTDLSGIRSQASTYGGDLVTNVNSLLDSAASYYGQYNIPTVTKQGGATVGVGLDQLLNYNLGKGSGSINRLIDNAQAYVGQTLTADQLTAAGVKIKEDKNNPGTFVSRVGGDTKTLTYFTQNPDGTYTGVGVNRVAVPSQDGGLFGSTLGKLALGLGGFFLGPGVGSLLQVGGSLGSTLGGGLLGGIANVLGGGKFIPGAIIGGGGGFAGGGGFTNLFGGNQAIPFSDALAESQFAAADAAQMASQGLSNSAIQQNLIMSGFDPALSASLADQAIMGIGKEALGADMVGFGLGKGGTLYPGVATGALTGISQVGGGLWSNLKSYLPTGGTNIFGGGAGNYIAGNLINQALADQQAQQQQAGGYAGAAPDYSGLIRLLSAPSARLSLV